MIPDFQTIMLPFLKIHEDNNEHEIGEIINILCKQFNLTEAEKNELLPSGNQRIINNRIGWARTYLKKANLIEYVKRATFKITPDGQSILNSNPKKIDVKFLEKLPAFRKWRESYQSSNGKVNDKKEDALIDVEVSKTPEERLEYTVNRLKESLIEELLEKVKSSSYSFFETLVIDLLIKMGYGGSKKEAGKVIGGSGDGGIDGIIKEDKLGLETIYVQAKKWEKTVPIGQIRDFAGSLLGKKAKKGIFIATSDYPKAAYDFVGNIEPRIILINGIELAEFMIENNVGVSVKEKYEVKRIDLEYFEEI